MPTPQQVQSLLNQVERKKELDRAEVKHKETNDKLDSLNESIKGLDLSDKVSELVNEIKNIKIEVPSVKVKSPDIIIPEIKIPNIKVNVPEIKIPEIKVPVCNITVPKPKVIINNPDEVKVKEPNWLNKLINPVVEAIKNKVIPSTVFPKTASEAIPVRLSNGKKFYEVLSNLGTQIGGAVDTSDLAKEAKQLPDNHQVTVSNIASVPVITGFAISAKQLPDNHQVAVSNFPTTQPVNGTVAISNTVPSANTMVEVPFTTTTVQAVASTDVSSYRGVGVQIITQGGSSTVTFQGSNDNTNWVSVALTISTSVTTAPVVSTTTTGAYYGPLHFKYFRLNITGIASGTTAGVITFSTTYGHSNPITTTAVTLAAAATNVAKAEDAVAASGSVGIPPLTVRSDTLPVDAGVSASGDFAFMLCDVSGRLYTNSMMVGKTGDTTYQVPRIDETTHALNIIDYSHHEIHSGSSFTSCHKADIANSANLDILLVTPNTTKWSHLTYELEVEAETDINIYEAPTASNNGTSLGIYNRDRNSANTAGTTVFHTPTVAGGAEGTLIRCWHLGSGKTFGGGDRGTHEIILKQNTKYLIRLTNATTGTNYMAIKVDFYEHTNRTA